MSANPHANGGALIRDLILRPFRLRCSSVNAWSGHLRELTRPLGAWLRDIFADNAQADNFRLFCPDETNSNRLGVVFAVENRCFVAPTSCQ